MYKITRLDTVIEGLRGKILGLTFVKKDGTVRRMNGIFGVRRFLKGGVFNGDPKKYIVIWDINKRDYRSVNRFTISEVRYGRMVYRIGDVLGAPKATVQEPVTPNQKNNRDRNLDASNQNAILGDN
jgi:hypothetical protein